MEKSRTGDDTIQIVRTPSGDEFVFLPRHEYDALLDELAEAREDLADVLAYDAAKAKLSASDVPPFPAEVNHLLLQRHRRLAAIRLWRGLSVADLALKSGLGEADIAAMESGDHMQTLDEAKKLAAALDVHVGWLEP
jgi:Helix-turn-helix